MFMVSGLAHAQQDCQSVNGTFVNHAVPPPECESPVLFCTLGILSGDLEGEYFFTMTSQTPDPQGPPVTMAFTGESTITLPEGQMMAQDHGSITFQVLTSSPFRTHVEIDEGTGAHAGVTGSLVADGEYDLLTGEGSGTYAGELCSA